MLTVSLVVSDFVVLMGLAACRGIVEQRVFCVRCSAIAVAGTELSFSLAVARELPELKESNEDQNEYAIHRDLSDRVAD